MFRRINQKLEAARINAQEKSDAEDAEDSEDSEDSEHELPASFNPSAVTFGDLSSEDEQEEEQDTARTKDVATNHQNQHSATAPPPSAFRLPPAEIAKKRAVARAKREAEKAEREREQAEEAARARAIADAEAARQAALVAAVTAQTDSDSEEEEPEGDGLDDNFDERMLVMTRQRGGRSGGGVTGA